MTTTADRRSDASPASRAPRTGLRRAAWLAAANLIVALLVAALTVLALRESLGLHRQRALDAADALAQAVSQIVSGEMAAVDLALRKLRTVTGSDDPMDVADALAELTRPVLTAERLRIVPVDDMAPALQAAWQADRRERLLVAGPREAGDGRWVIDLARPPQPGSREPALAAVAEYDIARIERLFAGLRLRGQSAISLRLSDLTLLARYSHPQQVQGGLGTRSSSRELVDALRRSPLAGTYLARSALDGIERANAYRQVDGVPMLLLVGTATADDLPAWQTEARTTIALALLVLGVVGVASVFAYRAWARDDASRQSLDIEREHLRALLFAASDGLHVLDREGRLVEFSDAFATMLGSDRAELAGAHVMRWERCYPAKQVDHVLRSFAVGRRLAFPSVFERADGTRIDVAIAATGVRIGQRDLLVLSARDVTEANRAVRRLRDSEVLLELTERIAGVGGWAWTPGDALIELTTQARRLLALPAQGARSARAMLRHLAREPRRDLLGAIARTVASGQVLDLELPLTIPGGQALWLHCVAERVSGADGQPRVVGVARDVTERHRRNAERGHEQALRRELQAQADMLRDRDEMLDVLAHEVRQPLNNASAAMQSALATLHEVGEQAAAPQLVRAQAVLGEVMARLDNTLAVSSLLALHGPIQREDTDLDMLLAVSIADMPASGRPRIHVQRETAARTVSIDMSLMRLALRNLLSNALKYSRPEADVTLRIADSEEPLGLVIDVIDLGHGIEPGLRDHLFERGARGRHTPGAEHGLGLYIVRRVMELHGGQARVHATGPGGTTMRLMIVEPDD